jgi:uncharacterized membrane protein YadS
MVAYGLQHVLSMYAGVVALPLIVGTALEFDPRQISYLISAGLSISGLATLLQTLGVWRIGARPADRAGAGRSDPRPAPSTGRCATSGWPRRPC